MFLGIFYVPTKYNYLQIRRMKCQHEGVVTKFCVSANCTSPSSQSCFYCLKRYHHHLPLQTLSHKEVESLIASLTITKDSRLKQGALKELLVGYFEGLKHEISRSLDEVCGNMLQRVSNSYLFSLKLNSALKKLRFRQFKKVSSAQLRQLHELIVKNTPVQLQQEQQKIYKCEVYKIKSTIAQIDKLFQSYQGQVQNYDRKLSLEPVYHRAINDLAQKILQQNTGDKLHKQLVEPQIQIRISSSKSNNNPQTEVDRKVIHEKSGPKLLTLEEYKKIKIPQPLKSNDMITFQKLNLPFPKKERKISITLDTDGKKNSNQPSPMNRNPHLLTPQNFNWKECHSAELSDKSDCSSNRSNNTFLQNKKIATPLSSRKDLLTTFDNREDVEKKLVRLQINQVDFQNTKQVDSPLLKRKIQSTLKNNFSLIQLKNPNRLIQIPTHQHDVILQSPKRGKFPLRKLSFNQQVPLNDEQLKSLALLLQSIKLTPQKAIPFLRKSFEYCPDNLSTAEYLSFLLIEENQPKECLELCNFVIGKVLAQGQNFTFSVHIMNNKAAALNLLGRFSESIQLLQNVLQNFEKDTLFKNLGDAYCALGIYEKAILNYQKSIQINNEYNEAYYNLAVCMYYQQNYQQALSLIQQAIHLDPDNLQYSEFYRNIKTML